MFPLADITSTQQADTLTALLFYAFAGLGAAGALGVVVTRNIVRTAVCLLFTLVGVSGLYFLLHAEFLAAVQLVVYAGGTLILIVFGVMLTSKSPFSRFEPKLVEVIIALTINLVLLIALVIGIKNTKFASHPLDGGDYPMLAFGQALLGDFLIPFELASVLLLAVLIGSAYLAKGRRRESHEIPPAGGSPELSRRAREWS